MPGSILLNDNILDPMATYHCFCLTGCPFLLQRATRFFPHGLIPTFMINVNTNLLKAN